MKNLKLSLSTLTFKATNLEIERWIRLFKFSVRWPENSFYHKFLALHVLFSPDCSCQWVRDTLQSKTQNLSCQRLWTRNLMVSKLWVQTDNLLTVTRRKTNSDSHTPLHLLTHKNTMKKEILAFTTTTASKFLKNRRNLYHAPKKNHLSSNYWFKKKAFH